MKNWRNITQYSTAVVAALSGIVLAFIQYFQSGDLTSGILGYVGEVLVFAAGIFGTTMYVNDRIGEVKTIVDKHNEIINDIKVANESL